VDGIDRRSDQILVVTAAYTGLRLGELAAVLLVTHEARVAAYADREVVLRDGRVDGTGLGIGVAG
jgi:ABC-type lipoprotein export system ATPase subunit